MMSSSRYVTPPGIDLEASQRGRIIGTCVALWLITDFVVALRIISRKLARVGYWWDDVLCIIAMAFANVLCIVWFTELRHGYGRHIYIWPASERMSKEIAWRREFFVVELFFHTAITICKLSVLAFYFRIFPYRQFRTVLWVVGTLALAYGISIDVSILFQCRPLHYQWDLPNPKEKGTCVHFHEFFVGKGIANVVLNVIIFMLPIPLLWRLRVTLRQQIVLTAMFTLAGFVIIVSIIWIIVVPDVTEGDITWASVNFGIWSTVEPHIAVICACLPSLRPLFTIVRKGVFQHPLIQNTFNTKSDTRNGSIHSIKPSKLFAAGGSSGSHDHDGRFSRLDEMDDLRPLGHGTNVQASRPSKKDEEGAHRNADVAVPGLRIGVKTDVVVEISDRLAYNDRLY